MIPRIANTPLASREWRLANLYTIRDDKGVLRKFDPNMAQRQFYNRMWYCNHVLKARKLGFSTFVEVLFADDLIFSASGLSAGIIDYTLEDAVSKLEMLKIAWEHLDNGDIHPDTWKVGAAIKKAVPLVTQSSQRLVFGNGSTARCSTSLRGATPQRLHVSELGKTSIWAPKKATEIVNGAFNSMTPGNVRNIESTHEGGKAGVHYRLLQSAMRNDDSQLSEIQSRFHFFPWYQDPRYVLRVNGRKLRPEMTKYFEKLRETHGITLTPEQMRWYDDKQVEQGHGMKKEFPTTPGEAFEAIAEGAIYGREMADLRGRGRIATKPFGCEAGLPMYTFSDIGLSDYFSDWLIQPIGRHVLVLDWFERDGLSAARVADHWRHWSEKWQRPISGHFLPHDAGRRSPNDAMSYLQALSNAGVQNIVQVPRTPDVWLGIGYVRDVLPHCWFNSFCDTPRNKDGTPHEPDDTQEDFPSGVACLEGYQRNLATTGEQLREMPKHDLFSHSADAFRTFAEAWRRGMINPQSSGTPRVIGGSATKPRVRR